MPQKPGRGPRGSTEAQPRPSTRRAGRTTLLSPFPRDRGESPAPSRSPRSPTGLTTDSVSPLISWYNLPTAGTEKTGHGDAVYPPIGRDLPEGRRGHRPRRTTPSALENRGGGAPPPKGGTGHLVDPTPPPPKQPRTYEGTADTRTRGVPRNGTCPESREGARDGRASSRGRLSGAPRLRRGDSRGRKRRRETQLHAREPRVPARGPSYPPRASTRGPCQCPSASGTGPGQFGRRPGPGRPGVRAGKTPGDNPLARARARAAAGARSALHPWMRLWPREPLRFWALGLKPRRGLGCDFVTLVSSSSPIF